MAKFDEERRDERWQAEVVDGLARMLQVLHDLSDEVRAISARLSEPRSAETQPPAPQLPTLLSVRALAEELGVSPATIYSMRSTGSGPPATTLGSRVFFRREDVEEWLAAHRERRPPPDQPWRTAGLARFAPSTSSPHRAGKAIEWCRGSHTEPMAASRYAGRAICRDCRDDVLVNRDGRLRKHRPRGF